MKVNLKKIGAIVAGATILASSVAFASLWFGNTALVNDQGNTVAKVVVGEHAAASDGVAAANIAAQIAANAWKSTTFTAQVSGSATCAVGDTTGAGACAISNEQAKLQITVPGSATPGTYTLNSLIADITDRTILDRGQGSLTVYNRTTAETSAESHPFSDGGSAGGLSGVTNEELYRIGGNSFDPFKQVSVRDGDGGRDYKESQYLFVQAQSQYRDSFDDVGGKFKDFIYQVKFDHDQYGIPVCTVSENSSWETCSTTSTDHTQNHKVKIKFLGSDWVITKLDDPNTVIQNETTVVTGGEVDLAKESVGGIINVGESLDAAGGVKVRLDDIKEGSSASEQSAIVSILDANGAVLKQTTISPGVTQTVSTSGGVQVRVRVFKTAPGYTFGAKWADMSVISNEMKLKDGDIVDVNGNRDVNSKWKVRLAWKNRDVGTSAGSINNSDHLRAIIIYRDSSDFLKKGEGYNLVEDPTGFKFTFKGLDMNPSSDTDYDTLKYEYQDTGGSFNYVADGSTTTTRESNASGFIKVTTGVSGGFSTSQGTGSEVRILLLSDNTATILDTTANISKSAFDGFNAGGRHSLVPGSVIMKLEGTPERWVFLGNLTSTTLQFSTNGFTNDTYVNLQYSTAGASASLGAGGLIRMGWAMAGNASGGNNWQSSTGTSGGANFSATAADGTSGAAASAQNITNLGGLVILLSEDSGEGQSSSKPDAIAAYFNLTAKSFNKDSPNTRYQKDKCTTASSGNFSSTRSGHDLEFSTAEPYTKEVNYITPRGTVCKELSDTVFTLKVAKGRPAHPQYLLSNADAAAGEDSGYTATLGEGESYEVPGTGGVVVKVTEISEKVGACGVGTGGAPACTVDSAGQSAVVLADGKDPKATYTGALPGSVSQSLVVLDRDASGVDVLVTVGGPAVNEVTKSVLEGSSVDFNTETKVVKEVADGKKIVVAGLTADDTLEAAKDFIAQLKSQ